jgi:polar amino acid transport system substrate-binding protein
MYTVLPRIAMKTAAPMLGRLLAATICLALASNAKAQTLDRIAATKIVRIGFIADQAPFAARGDGGPPVGYAIDVCNRIADEIGKQVDGLTREYVETTLPGAFDAVAGGTIDFLCGAVTTTLSRRQAVDFSEPIFVTGASALLRTDATRDLRELFLGERAISPPRSPELRPFAVSSVGVRLGTTTEATLRAAVAREGYKVAVVGFAAHLDGLAALEAREIDAYFADRVLLVELVKQARDPSGLVVGTRLLTREPYGIALRRNDADARLLVDRTLTDFFATSAFSDLLAKYFGAAAPGIREQILALSVPN